MPQIRQKYVQETPGPSHEKDKRSTGVICRIYGHSVVYSGRGSAFCFVQIKNN